MDPLTRLGHRTWMLANSDSTTAKAVPTRLQPYRLRLHCHFMHVAAGEQPLVLCESLEPENTSHPERRQEWAEKCHRHAHHGNTRTSRLLKPECLRVSNRA